MARWHLTVADRRMTTNALLTGDEYAVHWRANTAARLPSRPVHRHRVTKTVIAVAIRTVQTLAMNYQSWCKRGIVYANCNHNAARRTQVHKIGMLDV